MSYQDDEEFKETDVDAEVGEEDLLTDPELDEPLDDDLVAISENEDDEESEAFADIDGAEY
jgi:hypothetical protein